MLSAMTAGGTIEPRISRSLALQVPAVLRARNLIAGSLGTLPIRVHAPDRSIAKGDYLVPRPDPEIPHSVTLAETVEDLLFEGISWWQVTSRRPDRFPLTARHVPHSSVAVATRGAVLAEPEQPCCRPGR